MRGRDRDLALIHIALESSYLWVALWAFWGQELQVLEVDACARACTYLCVLHQ